MLVRFVRQCAIQCVLVIKLYYTVLEASGEEMTGKASHAAATHTAAKCLHTMHNLSSHRNCYEDTVA